MQAGGMTISPVVADARKSDKMTPVIGSRRAGWRGGNAAGLHVKRRKDRYNSRRKAIKESEW
jgi:hypothetical protein